MDADQMIDADQVMDADQMFAPLTPRRPEFYSHPGDVERGVVPIPADEPNREFFHNRLGVPAKVWPYRDLHGALLGYVCRFETEHGKEVLPFTFWETAGGQRRWIWRSWDKPRPLYG